MPLGLEYVKTAVRAPSRFPVPLMCRKRPEAVIRANLSDWWTPSCLSAPCAREKTITLNYINDTKGIMRMRAECKLSRKNLYMSPREGFMSVVPCPKLQRCGRRKYEEQGVASIF